MTDLLIFEGHNVEVFELNNVVYFNPRHVGECLDLTESAIRMAIKKMSPTQVRKLTNSDVNQFDIRKMNNAGENFFTESGVYKLAFRSDKPEAERFTNWVTDTVLPQIRKTGGYIPTVTATATPMSDAEIMASALLIAHKTIEARTNELTTANQTIQDLTPKAAYTDLVLKSKGLMNVKQIAQDYGMTAVAFNKLLHDLGVQYKDTRTGQWILYSKYQGLGWVGSMSVDIVRSDETPDVAVHTKWTQKGRLGIYDLLKSKGYIPVMEAQYEDYINGTN